MCWDWRSLPRKAREGALGDYLREDRRRWFVLSFAPLLRVALIRLGIREYAMVLSSHHIVLDGWCVPLLLGEVLELYQAAISGRDPDLPRPRPFREYVAWLHRQDLTGAEAFWRRVIGDYPGPIPLGIETASDPAITQFGEHETRLDTATTKALTAFARSRRLTLGTLIQGAWAILLSRYSGRHDVIFGTTVSGRPADLEGVEEHRRRPGSTRCPRRVARGGRGAASGLAGRDSGRTRRDAGVTSLARL